MKDRIAIVVPGGVGAGYFSQGIPALWDFLQRISACHQVTVYSMIVADKVPPGKLFRFRCARANHKDSSFKKNIKTALLLIQDHRKEKFDLIHGIWGYPSGSIAVVLGKILKIPSVVSLQGGETANVPEIGYGLLRNSLLRKLIFWTCTQADQCTALTYFQVRQLESAGYRGTPFQIIPYGTDEQKFSFCKKSLQSPFHLLHIGNLTAVKDQGTLLRAFKIVADKINCFLKIIGDGEEMESLRRLSGDLGIENRVEFTGALPHQEIHEHLCRAHVLLHTSLHEAQAVVVAEAAASGTVVAGTNVGLLADWGEDKCIVVAPGQHELLGSKVADLLHDPEHYYKLQKNAWEWHKENTATHSAENFLKLYAGILESTHHQSNDRNNSR